MNLDRNAVYKALDILAVISGCVFVGAKAGRLLMKKYIKEAAKAWVKR